MRDAFAVLVAFLCGSVPFGWILVRLSRGMDVRTIGSGNIGATNVARAAGAGVGVAVLALDALKGVAAIFLGRWVAGPSPPPWLAAALVVAPVAGHMFTPWLRFRGGKGVATALGVLAATDWRLLVVGAAAFALVAGVWRIVSLGSIVAALAVGAGGLLSPAAGPSRWGVAAAAALVVMRHRENIRRLLHGEEPRVRARRGAEAQK